MTEKLPPLSWFRAFEAAARHQSMTSAAQELGLTQPAVSQQIKLLEHRFGMTLFDRQPKGLVLTDDGRRLLPQVSDSIGGLARLITEFDTQQRKGMLTVAASASFARSIIAPALPNFLNTYPEAQIRFLSALWPDDFHRTDADIEVRFGHTQPESSREHLLIPDHTVAVCTPGFLVGRPDWHSVCQARLIQTAGTSETWESWCRATGLTLPGGKVLVADSHGFAIDLALQGAGVALTNLLYAAPYLHRRGLIMPVAARTQAQESYTVIARKRSKNSLADPFYAWLQKEIRRREQMAQNILA